MRLKIFGALFAGVVMPLACVTAVSAQQSAGDQNPGQSSGDGSGQGRMRGGFGDFPGGGRGVLGAVTGVAADHYTIKTGDGEIYTVHFSVNTRIVKQPAGGRQRGQGGQGDAEGPRPTPQPLKPADIKVGDVITAGGEVDSTAKSVGAVFIVQVDPERAKQMREMEANWGKTWLAGRITAIQDTTITIEGMVDHHPHAIAVDENTSFRQRRESITLADIKPGEQLRAEGAVKGGVFLATTVTAMQPQANREGGRQGGPDQPPNPIAAPNPQ